MSSSHKVFIAAVLSFFLLLNCFCVPSAFASTVSSSQQDSVNLSLTEQTAVIGNQTGYRSSIKITNNTSSSLQQGTLTVRISPQNIQSAALLQQWEEESANLPTPFLLYTGTVPRIKAHQSVTIDINDSSSNLTLQALKSWGAKPVEFLYNAETEYDKSVVSQLNTVVTRNTEGLSPISSSLTITPVLHLTSQTLEPNSQLLANTISTLNSTSGVQVLRETAQGNKDLSADENLLSSHSMLQVIADPVLTTTTNFFRKNSDQIAGLTQPYGFDITGVTALPQNDQDVLSTLGLSAQSWDINAIHQLLQKPDTKNLMDLPDIAWEGSSSWTAASLAAARAAGFKDILSMTAESNNHEVQTDAFTQSTPYGDVTVLAAQKTLSTLADGNPTTQWSLSESTEAGRISRFIAQTAVDDMENPSLSRDLLVVFGGGQQNAAETAALLNNLQTCEWIKFSTLKALLATVNSSDTDNGNNFTLTTAAATTKEQAALNQQIQSSQQTAQAIDRVCDRISDHHSNKQVISAWTHQVNTMHHSLLMLAFGTARSSADKNFGNDLLDSVSIASPQSIQVFSETAQMPVTIANKLPFPVKVTVHAYTNSNATTISPSTTVFVKCNGEAQATFHIKVVGASMATAKFILEDHQHQPFGAITKTQITSQLTLNDMNGTVLVIFAVVLGLIGLWRQFHLRKDPDQ